MEKVVTGKTYAEFPQHGSRGKVNLVNKMIMGISVLHNDFRNWNLVIPVMEVSFAGYLWPRKYKIKVNRTWGGETRLNIKGFIVQVSPRIYYFGPLYFLFKNIFRLI